MQITDLLKNRFVFDVGCNVGRKAEQYMAAGTQVIGFEPQEDLAKFTEKRLGITVENVALSNSVGTAPIWRATENQITSMSQEFIGHTGHRFQGHSWNKEPEYVKTDTLDNMIAKYGKPFYIKIDVEGYELSVLQGLTKQIDIISIEFMAELMKNTFACLDYVGYKDREYNVVIGEGPNFHFKDWVDYGKISWMLNTFNCKNFDWGDVYIKKNEKSH